MKTSERAVPGQLASVFSAYQGELTRLAAFILGDRGAGEDVVQDLFVRLHQRGFRADDGDPRPYLRTAVVNGSRSVLRRRKTAREYTPPHQVNARSAESLAMLSAEHQGVVNALGKLPPRQREVLVLRYYGGLSEAEIAEAAGISKGTVKSTASRALEALQQIMGGAAPLR